MSRMHDILATTTLIAQALKSTQSTLYCTNRGGVIVEYLFDSLIPMREGKLDDKLKTENQNEATSAYLWYARGTRTERRNRNMQDTQATS